jgi:hypothetical protein
MLLAASLEVSNLCQFCHPGVAIEERKQSEALSHKRAQTSHDSQRPTQDMMVSGDTGSGPHTLLSNGYVCGQHTAVEAGKLGSWLLSPHAGDHLPVTPPFVPSISTAYFVLETNEIAILGLAEWLRW